MRFALSAILWASTVVSKVSSLVSSTTIFGLKQTSRDYLVDSPSLQTSLQTPSSHTVTSLYSTTEEQQVLVEEQLSAKTVVEIISVLPEEEEEASAVEVTAPAINARLEQQLDNMRLKDQTSKQLTKEVGEILSGKGLLSWFAC
jgi:hypothetical protein